MLYFFSLFIVRKQNLKKAALFLKMMMMFYEILMKQIVAICFLCKICFLLFLVGFCCLFVIKHLYLYILKVILTKSSSSNNNDLDLSLVFSNQTAVQIEWQNPNVTLTFDCFRFHYKEKSGKSVSLMLPNTSTSHFVDNLDPGCTYFIYLDLILNNLTLATDFIEVYTSSLAFVCFFLTYV